MAFLKKSVGGPNAHLASIENQDESDLIHLIMVGSENIPGPSTNYWIGLVKYEDSMCLILNYEV